MATPQEKPTHGNETWPVRDDDYSQDFEETISSSECGCIRGLFWWRRNSNEGHGYLLHQQAVEELRESWLKKKAKKLKEFWQGQSGRISFAGLVYMGLTRKEGR
ncbi:hypothetical protein CRYUN_Cryun02cG0064300 [Craigia yunnanensis]